MTAQVIRPMSVADAAAVAAWRYRDRWAVYDLPSADALLPELADYRVFADEGVIEADIVGFFCTGAAARVPGLAEDPAVVDVGVGMNPARVGQGGGAAFGRAVLAQVAREHPGRSLRAVVQAWNERSLRLCRRLGFVEVGELAGGYRILVRSAESSPV